MPSIDERIVAISFENTKFEANVATTMATLSKLDTAIKNIGSTSGLSKIETDSQKVTLTGPMSALDKLKQKLGLTNAGTTFTDMENASNKVTLTAPMSALDKLKQKLGFTNAGTTFTDMEAASDKVTLTQPMTALDKLKQKLGVTGAGTTFTDMEAAADRISFGGLSKAIDGIGTKFSVLQGAASVALGGIAATAATKGAAFAKSFALGPIIDGFKEYGTNLNSIQTILANTSDSGGNLKTVNAALNELNTYSDKTIYNFSEMAKNIGTFTAAGVQLKPATAAIKGIANLAALSGSNSQQASTAMYQLSQAIASGKVGLQDWNSVVNAGMGGAVFQKALERTGENMGTIAKGAVQVDKATGKATVNGQSFRESIMAKPGQQSWLTSDVLTKTLSQFTGDLSDAQLAAEGFSKEQIKTIQNQAKLAQDAATQVKTLPQVFDVARETIGSGWGKTFQTIFGDFGESKKTFTDLSNTINNFINTNSNARNKVLSDWKALGGRTELIKGIKSAWADLMGVIKPIKDAFRDIFPAETGKNLFELTKNFRELMDNLRPSKATMENLKRTFEGFFAILHIGWTIVKDVGKVFGDLLGAVGKSAGGILGITASIGDFLKALDQSISKGDSLSGFFGGLEGVLKVPVELIKALAGAIGSLFGGGNVKGSQVFSSSMGGLSKALGPMAGIMTAVTKAWDGFTNILGKVKDAVSPLLNNIAGVLSNFGDIVAKGIKTANYDKVFEAINTVLLGGIFLAIKKAIGGGISVDFGGGALKNINEMFETLTGNLKAMQKNIQAKTLLEIAAAIAILAAGITLLSLIEPKKLATAMTAVAIGLGELVGAMKLMTTGLGAAGFIQAPFIAGALVLLATAMVILAAAVKIFSTMSWAELARGLTGVAGSLTGIGLATKLMDGPKLIVTAAALLPLAIALNILAVAVKIFSTMSWEQIGKGLLGVTAALAGIGLAMQLMPADAALMGPSLVLIAIALTLLAGAVGAFGKLKLETIFKGIFGIAASLVMIGLAIDTIPPTIALQAAGLLILAAALAGISAAIAIFGNMKVGTLFKGILAMGAALVVLGIGLTAMEGTLPGSVALLAAAAALAILGPTLAFMGHLEWGTILKGLAVMGLTLTVLGVAGLIAAPALLALGVALAVVGAAMLLMGGAIYLAASGISMLSDKSVKAFATLIAAGGAFILVFPTMVINFVKGIVQILQSVADLAPKIITALISIVGQLLGAIVTLAPKIAVAIGALITAIVAVLNQNAGPIIAAGFQLLVNLLSGIANNIGKITEQVANIITNFLNGLANGAPRIASAGVNLLTSFLSGITNNLPKLVGTVATMMATFLANVTKHIPEIVGAAGTLITKFINSVAGQVPRLISAGTNVITNFLTGIGNAIPRIVGKATDIAGKFITALGKGLLKLVNTGFDALINFMNGLADAIRKNSPRIWNAGWNIASAILEGMWQGLTDKAHAFLAKVADIAKKALHLMTHPWEAFSPSRVTMELGKNIMLGLIIGLDQNSAGVNDSLTSAANDAIDTAKSSFGNLSGVLNGIMETEPVIAPVLDLSNVKKDATQLSDIIAIPPIAAVTSFDQAKTISDQQAATLAAAAVGPVAKVPAAMVNFEQNNYSPDPLSPIELYRQTNNQLARLKSLVGVT